MQLHIIPLGYCYCPEISNHLAGFQWSSNLLWLKSLSNKWEMRQSQNIFEVKKDILNMLVFVSEGGISCLLSKYKSKGLQ